MKAPTRKSGLSWRAAAAGTAALLFLPGISRAAGFALVEQSGRGLGEAYAGGVTDTADASSLFYNPAAMAWMNRDEAALDGTLFIIGSDFRDRGSTTARGRPLRGDDGSKVHHHGAPSLYCVAGLAEDVKLGFGLNTPFATASGYDSGWKGRYHATKTEMYSATFGPALAVRLTDILSLGAGVSLQYLEARFENAIDFGSILSGAGAVPQNLDGAADLIGSDLDLGFSLGALADLPTGTRIGLSYRSAVNHALRGSVDFDVPDTARKILDRKGMSDYFTDTGSLAAITTPENISLGVAHDLNAAWALAATVTWTRWSRFQELVVAFDSPQPDDVTEERWCDTLRYSLGLAYAPIENLTLQAGIAYDEAPGRISCRTPRFPDYAQFWLALGAGWAVADSFRLDFGYAHIFIPDTPSQLMNKPEAGFLIGEYRPSVDIISFQTAVFF